MKWFMRIMCPEALWWLASLGTLGFCFWVFHALLFAAPFPTFGAGVLGGAIWTLVTVGVSNVVRWTSEDFRDAIRRESKSKGVE